MKKLTAILKQCELLDKMFDLRKKHIKTALTAARNDVEEQAARAELNYEQACRKLGDKEVSDYKRIINDMLYARAIMHDAARTLEVLEEIEADLESEVEAKE